MKTAFIGLGVMGFPMAGHLQAAGHEVTVYNRTAQKAARWVEKHGGKSDPTIAGASKGAQIVALCVGNDDDVRAVVAQILPALEAGAIIVDHTTTSAKVAREMAELCAAKGVGFLDAPVSGGQAGAENGQLTIMVGGDEGSYAAAEPVLNVYAKAMRRMGPSGAGQLTKMCNQIAIAGVVQGVAEALDFAKRAGLPTDDVLAAISKGAAQSWQMENRWGTMSRGEFEFGFAVDWMRKDLGIALDEAASNGAALDMTRMIDGFYGEVQAMGGNRWDTSSLVARLEKK
ncbi:NAD(P)-dependent oxidoreductase [Caulobacter endophyticus]|uniref:NAD(P)-dependent oxidoreductase n=1 Tax=Caulobacter endophyticus TaxID=2172652 RepID=UPI00241056FB|nr:NAD(P)-dependent oxidoreductase [Caulobacter endophyticus]MDG2528708.1 NAD(P)-dependent oxidoreductase [Caulobacter endophyticus]